MTLQCMAATSATHGAEASIEGTWPLEGESGSKNSSYEELLSIAVKTYHGMGGGRNSAGMTSEHIDAVFPRLEDHFGLCRIGTECDASAGNLEPEMEVPAYHSKTNVLDEAWIALQSGDCTRRLKHKKRPALGAGFDPAGWEHLDNDCFFACTFWSLHGMVPSGKAIAWTRWKYIQAWKAANNRPETEGDMDYVHTYLRHGWGGLPELHTYASISGKTICLLDGTYRIYRWVEPTSGCQGIIEYWQYSDQHYRVLARNDNGFRWRCSLSSAMYGSSETTMRGGAGSPVRSGRVDKDNKEKKQKKNRVELKEAKEIPPQYEAPPVPKEDPRPPLQRKRKIVDDRPPLERKRRTLPTAHKVDAGNMGDPARIQMTASSSPSGTQCKTQASSSSSTVPCPLTALLKKADEEADDKFKDRPEAVLGLLQMREGHYFCILCRKWVTDLHLRSSHHMKQLMWYQKLCPQERIPELAKLMKYVHEYFKQREEDAGVEARGGMPSSSSGSLPAKAEVKQKGDGTDGVPKGEGGVGPQEGHDSSSGSAGSDAVVEQCEGEGALRDEKGRAVLILSSKFKIRFSVCKHTLTNAVFVALSYVMNIHSSKVVLLCKGERVVWDIEVTTVATRGWSWIATSAPLSSPAHLYRLQSKQPVDMPM